MQAGPLTAQPATSNNQVTTQWPSEEQQFTKPDQTVFSVSGPPETATHTAPSAQAQPEGPQKYAPMYKCGNAKHPSFQDTPCDKQHGELYHSDANPNKPVY